MGGICIMHERDENSIEKCNRKIWREETSWEIQAWMGG